MRVFIGFDPRQPVAFHVLAHSIWKHAEMPVDITQLRLSTLPIHRRGLTEFTYSRFLCPYLSDYKGISLFMDSDMLALSDIAELLAYAVGFPEIPVFVVKNKRKFEWSSLMLFRNELCRTLTPDYVDNPANALFDFKWASQVGELPSVWNHLVGYDAKQDSKIVHFTQGIPCWKETSGCEYAEDWKREYAQMCSTVGFEALMGQSVHARLVRGR